MRQSRHDQAVAIAVYGYAAPPSAPPMDDIVDTLSLKGDEISDMADQLANDFGKSRAYWMKKLGGGQ